jgi:aspartate kinase
LKYFGEAMKVMKFGGSTFKTPEMMERVVEVIKKDQGNCVIVVSALHGQTNEIREYISKIRTEKKEIDSFIKIIKQKHFNFAKEVIQDAEIQKKVIDTLDKYILKLERLLFGVAYTEELTPRTTDLILSSAERMSLHIMDGVLRSHGLLTKAYEADQIGIITDDEFCNATADLKSTERNLRKLINDDIKGGAIPIITGFIGCDSEGRTTTFGKNGSDYSAAVIAYSINASTLELWKDVDGFMSANPKLITNAYTIKKLSYDEAAELAHFGIGLLHPRTVEPVRLKIIPIEIKNIQNPNNEGTEIVKKGFIAPDIIKSVVYSTDLVEIKLSAVGGSHRPGLLAEVTKILFDSKINIYSITTSQSYISILIYKTDLQSCMKVLDKLSVSAIKQIDPIRDIALICVVGEGAGETTGLASKIFSSVASAGVNIRVISAGASRVASHFIIQEKDLEKTVLAIHDQFCKNKIR